MDIMEMMAMHFVGQAQGKFTAQPSPLVMSLDVASTSLKAHAFIPKTATTLVSNYPIIVNCKQILSAKIVLIC